MFKLKNKKSILKYINIDGLVYHITYNKVTSKYAIYEKVIDGYVRLGIGNNPIELENKYIKLKKKQKGEKL